MDIVVITDSGGYGWHAERIRDTLEKNGCRAHFADLPQCALIAGEKQYCVRIPGFENRLPDGVLVRNVPRGTLQEVVFYLGILHALAHYGVTIHNDARGIERTVDKSMTSFLIHHAGLPTPAVWTGCDEAAARTWAAQRLRNGIRVVAKPLFGSQGKGLRLLSSETELDTLTPPDNDIWFGGVYYLQEFVDTGRECWCDWRVFVIGGHAVAAMSRYGETWINNVAQGSRCEALALTPQITKPAEKAAQVCGLSYAGIDLIQDIKGNIQIIEINSIPSWKGLQGTTSLDITDTLIKQFLSSC